MAVWAGRAAVNRNFYCLNSMDSFIYLLHSCYLIIVAENVIYYQSLSCDFAFDDSIAIVKNRDVRWIHTRS